MCCFQVKSAAVMMNSEHLAFYVELLFCLSTAKQQYCTHIKHCFIVTGVSFP